MNQLSEIPIEIEISQLAKLNTISPLNSEVKLGLVEMTSYNSGSSLIGILHEVDQ